MCPVVVIVHKHRISDVDIQDGVTPSRKDLRSCLPAVLGTRHPIWYLHNFSGSNCTELKCYIYLVCC